MIEVLKAAERAAGLTRQLLAFTHQQITEKRPIDLNESLAQLHRLLLRTLGDHIALSVVPSAEPAVVRIDAVQFDQIALNLAVNARDAMSNGGHLRIALNHAQKPNAEPNDAGWVRLTVTDTGAGMDEETQVRIFEPFFTTKERGKGTGLGLATCFGIVTEAGGKIRVKSALGHGTTFTVELPLCKELPNSLGVSVRPPIHTSRGETVLLAEDDPPLRRVTARVLRRAGYTVYEAANGTEAKQKLDELSTKIDILVSDVVMPGCSGYDLVAYAKLLAPRSAVLLMSGFVDTAARKGEAEDVPILWKPVSQDDLVHAIGKALEGRLSTSSAPTSGVLVTGAATDTSQATMEVLASGTYARGPWPRLPTRRV